ncbi:MAG: helix-turn-helix transcriptional regulator [Phycisphaerae bacterium]|nr:helix-turn-helix transcriptional regulator [Phycisphaerae bacterium]
MAKVKNIVGSRVRLARTKYTPLSQDQVSARLARLGIQIDRAGISKIENGMRRVYDFEVKALAKVLAVSTGWLLGEE